MQSIVLNFSNFVNESQSLKPTLVFDDDLTNKQLFKFHPLDERLPIGYFEFDNHSEYLTHHLKIELLTSEEFTSTLELIKLGLVDPRTISSILHLDYKTDVIDEYSLFHIDLPIKVLVTCTRTNRWHLSPVGNSRKGDSWKGHDGTTIETSKLVFGMEELGETKEVILDNVLETIGYLYDSNIKFVFSRLFFEPEEPEYDG